MHSRPDASKKLWTYCICPAQLICACGVDSIRTGKMHVWDFWIAPDKVFGRKRRYIKENCDKWQPYVSEAYNNAYNRFHCP